MGLDPAIYDRFCRIRASTVKIIFLNIRKQHVTFYRRCCSFRIVTVIATLGNLLARNWSGLDETGPQEVEMIIIEAPNWKLPSNFFIFKYKKKGLGF
jgi:hypothetical protein